MEKKESVLKRKGDNETRNWKQKTRKGMKQYVQE